MPFEEGKGGVCGQCAFGRQRMHMPCRELHCMGVAVQYQQYRAEVG